MMDLEKILQLLHTTGDVNVQIKIFSTLSAYIISKDVKTDVIITYNPIYDQICYMLSNCPLNKTIVLFNFLSALIYSVDEENERSTLVLYAKNMIRSSGCLATICELFRSCMMHQDVWRSLCQCLAETCRGIEANQSYCTHLVPICVQRSNERNIEILLVLQSLVQNHTKNISLFIECNGISIFRRALLQHNICLQLLNTVAQSSTQAVKLITDSQICQNLRIFLRLYGPESQLGKWATVILYHVTGQKESYDDDPQRKPTDYNNITKPYDMEDITNATQFIKNVMEEIVQCTPNSELQYLQQTSFRKDNTIFHTKQNNNIFPIKKNGNIFSHKELTKNQITLKGINNIKGDDGVLNIDNPKFKYLQQTSFKKDGNLFPIQKDKIFPVNNNGNTFSNKEFTRNPRILKGIRNIKPDYDDVRNVAIDDDDNFLNVDNPKLKYLQQTSFKKDSNLFPIKNDKIFPAKRNVNIFSNKELTRNEIILKGIHSIKNDENGIRQLDIDDDILDVDNPESEKDDFSFLFLESQNHPKSINLRMKHVPSHNILDNFPTIPDLKTETKEKSSIWRESFSVKNNSFKNLNFIPRFASTPKKSNKSLLNGTNKQYIQNIKRDRSTSVSFINRKMNRKIKNKKLSASSVRTSSCLDKTKTDKNNRQNSISGRFFEAINESCTAFVKTVKNIFKTKNSTAIDRDKEKSINLKFVKDHSCSYSFTNYMKKRDAILNNECTQSYIDSNDFSINSMRSSCNTCNDTLALKHKLKNDEYLKQTVRKLKLGINLYGCDFKRISNQLWPQKTYMTPTVLYNLYRKLIVK